MNHKTVLEYDDEDIAQTREAIAFWEQMLDPQQINVMLTPQRRELLQRLLNVAAHIAPARDGVRGGG